MGIFSINKKSRIAPKCKTCGALMLPIAYGYPAESMIRAEERGEIILGGCDFSANDPVWGCRHGRTDDF